MGDPRVDHAPGRPRRRGARVYRGVSGSSTKVRLLRGSTARPRDSSAPCLAQRRLTRRQPGKTGCRGVAGSSCGAPQEARFGGAPRNTSINARAAPAGPPGRVVDARIAHRAPSGQISPKNEKTSGTPAKTRAARLARRGNPNPRLSPPTDLRRKKMPCVCPKKDPDDSVLTCPFVNFVLITLLAYTS